MLRDRKAVVWGRPHLLADVEFSVDLTLSIWSAFRKDFVSFFFCYLCAEPLKKAELLGAGK